jgi:predicted nucleic-acid-binding protein
MKAIDTNVLIRFLIKDDPQQAEIVYRLFKNVESSKEKLFLPITVVLETIWVLESAYKIPRQEISDAIGELLLMPMLQFESQSAIVGFVNTAKETEIDLSDILIAHSALFAGCECTLTFDKHASGFAPFQLLR